MGKKVWVWISSIPPSCLAASYFAVIVLYPVLYTYIKGGFYAPYVHLEPSAKSDEYDAGQLIQSAWRATFHRRLAQGPVMIDGMTVQPDDLLVQQFKVSEDGTMRFNASVWLHRPNDGLDQTSFPVVINGDDVRLEKSVHSEDRYVRPVVLGALDTLYGEVSLARDAYQQLFKSSSSDAPEWPRIEMNKVDNGSMEAFLEGAEGNPLLIGSSYWRMLYFSAIVMTTVGFGDIVPLTPCARLATGLQAVLGVSLFGLFLNAVAYRANNPPA